MTKKILSVIIFFISCISVKAQVTVSIESNAAMQYLEMGANLSNKHVESGGSFYDGYTGVLPTIAHPTNVSSAPFLLNQTRTDTMVVTGTGLGSSYFGQVGGQDTLHPFVVYYNNSTGGGVQLENCFNMKVIAVGGNRTQSGGGVPLSITGHADYIQASGFVILNGSAGAIWCKTEAADACKYPNPVQWLYPVHMRNIWITNCRVGNADGTGFSSGDAFYLGSTGSKGDRPVPCLGNQLLKPMYMSGVHALYDTVYQCRRSAIQISGADSGYNEIKYCQIYNVGSEYCYLIAHPPYTKQDSIAALSQGAGIRTGYGDGNNVEIAYNNVVKTFLYNLDIETGTNVHDNIVDSSGFYGTCRNPQQIQNVQCYAQQPNSILKLQYNISGGHSTQPQSISFNISGSSNYSTTGNIVCGNVGKLQVVQPFTYATTCSTQDTTCETRDTTYYVDSDTTFHFDSTFRDSTSTVFVPDKVTVHALKRIGRFRVVITGDSVIEHHRVLVRPAYDSVGICTLCKRVDTTYQKCNFGTVTTYGTFLTPTDSTTTLASRLHLNKLYGCKGWRDNFNFGTPYQVKQAKDSGLLVYCMFGTSDNTIPTNQQALADSVTARLNQSAPTILGYLNETSGQYTGTAADYCAGLTTITPICHAHNVLVCNGGFTQDICYPMLQYYTQRGYIDSVTWLQGIFGNTLNLNGATAIAKLAFYNVVLPYIKNSALDFVDYHVYTQPYLHDSLSTTLNAFIPVSTGFIINQTGKPVISSEFGWRNTDATLNNGALTQFKQTQPQWIIGYINRGIYSYPNESVWTNFVANNP